MRCYGIDPLMNTNDAPISESARTVTAGHGFGGGGRPDGWCVALAYHENGGNESFPFSGSWLTLKANSDASQSHNFMVLKNDADKR